MPSFATLAATRSGRFTIAVAFALMLGLFWFRRPSVPGSDYITSLLSHSNSWQLHAASDANPEVLDPLNVDPLAVELLPDPDALFSKDKWFFEFDLPEESYSMPKFDKETLSKYTPHLYRGPGHKAFAMCFLSHNGSLYDPYFMGTQQVVYRLLWDPRSRSEKYPVVIFVPPYVPQEQRLMLSAAGAIVREVQLLKFEPNQKTNGFVAGRLKDVFTKLQMWNQTDFEKLTFLDSDANPIVNIDEIFDLAPTQTCKPELIPEEHKDLAPEICPYTFSGYKEWTGMLNAGVMIVQPNRAMHELLLREYNANEHFDNGFAEQALLSYVFDPNGAFPPSTIEEKWNANPDVPDRGGEVNIVHAKIWALFAKEGHWSQHIFEDTWNDMVKLYNSKEFETLRSQDGATGIA